MMPKVFVDISKQLQKGKTMCIMNLDKELFQLIKTTLDIPIIKKDVVYDFVKQLVTELVVVGDNKEDKKEVFSEKKNFIIIYYRNGKYQYQYIGGSVFLPNKEKLQTIKKYNSHDKIKYGLYTLTDEI